MITPSIHFQGNCDEAISFYKEVLGAEVKAINYAKDAPPDSGMEGFPPNFVMYSEVVIFNMTFTLSDGGETPIPYGNFSIMITYKTADEVKTIFGKLAEGGNATEPLSETFWAGLFGEVIDRFGVTWQVMIGQE